MRSHSRGRTRLPWMRMPWVVFVQDLLWESVGHYFSTLPFPLDLRQLWGEKQQKKKKEKGQAEILETSQVVKTQPSLHQEKGESQDTYVRLWIPSRGFWRPGMLLLFTDTADLGLCQGRGQAEEGGCMFVFPSSVWNTSSFLCRWHCLWPWLFVKSPSPLWNDEVVRIPSLKGWAAA